MEWHDSSYTRRGLTFQTLIDICIKRSLFFFKQKADLAITDLTITSERESGADFTMPFMNLGN